MNAKLTGIIGLLLGIGGGLLIGDRLLKEKYKAQADKEIASVKSAFRLEKMEKRKEAENPEDAPEKKRPSAEERRTYRQMVREQRYSPKPVEKKTPAPMLIDEEDLDDPENDHSYVTLNYFTDGTVTDEKGRPLDPDGVDENLGKTLWKQEFASLTDVDDHPTSVYVRNFEQKTDYEILYNAQTYKEFLEENPGVVE